ncbi:hypothetical protein AB0J74_03390 [Asanoa sp. NPDC049573]|uniref:hypothetical protein n=1 Tax=Asanoa sp. NPDC049573 TaxID=3155396 RepID=UPI00341263EF
MVEARGPVEMLPEKTRAAVSFAAFMPRRHGPDGHLVLARAAAHPTIHRVDVLSARNVLHAFRLRAPADLDPAFAVLLAAAYRVGRQEHLPRA